MRDIILYTKNPIIYDNCIQVILDNIKGATSNNKDYISSNTKYFWSFTIDNDSIYEDFTDEYMINEIKEFAKNLPIENPYTNLILVHRSIDAKRLVEILVKFHPELYINVNDSTNWLGSAQEYLDTEFDY